MSTFFSVRCLSFLQFFKPKIWRRRVIVYVIYFGKHLSLKARREKMKQPKKEIHKNPEQF